MHRHLNLVKSDFEKLEKRVFPSFPFCYLTFKAQSGNDLVFEIKDISQSGMQLGLKNGVHGIKEEQQIAGEIHWQGLKLDVLGDVKWATERRLGVEFSNRPKLREDIGAFLSVDNFAKNMKPIHQMDYGVDLPARLKYWLRSDGPVEIFVWQHADGEFSKFQLLLMENFIEWADGEGLKTGRIMSKRDIDTPLISEDEFVFKMDEVIDDNKVQSCRELIKQINNNLLSLQTLDFIKMKLGM
jgi:hypothetical protein